jgi:hypothetical protein
MTKTRSRSWRAAIGALAAVGLSFVPAMGVRAAEKVPVCEGFTPPSPCLATDPQVNWFWSSNTRLTVVANPPEDSPDGVPGVNVPVSGTEGVFGNPAPASPISAGHVGVSLLNGDPDMRGYIKFDLPAASEFTSFVVTLDVSLPDQKHSQRHSESGMKTPGTLNQQQAKILACAVTEPWAEMKVDGGDPPYATTVESDKLEAGDPNSSEGVSTQRTEPSSDCGNNVTGKPVSKGAQWRFDLTSMANKWAKGELFNEGVVLMPEASGAAQTWRLEFHGATLTVLPTTSVPQPVPLPTAPPETPQERVVYVNSKEAAFAVAEFIPAETLPPPPAPAPPPGDTGSLPPFSPTPTGDGVPQTPTGEVVPSEQPGAVPVAAPVNPAFWWWMLPIGAIGVGLYSSAIAQDPLPVSGGEGNRVARVLRRRRLEGAEGATEAATVATDESQE